MNNSIHIAAFLDSPEFLAKLVEQLAYRRYDIGYGIQKMPPDQQALDTSSSSIYLSGELAVSEKKEEFFMPFITSFLFTCVKSKDGDYKLTWSSSLS